MWYNIPMKKILYFHHGGAIGGAPLSLLFLLQRLDHTRYQPIVITTRPGPVLDRYRANGIEVHVADEYGGHIDDFSHTTLEWYNLSHWWPLPLRLLRFRQSVRTARHIVEHFQPDLVHINSSTLAAAAIGTHQAGVPLIWHIREPIAAGYFGLRHRWLTGIIDRTADRVVSISHSDAARLRPSDKVRVIYNFIDLSQFDPATDGTPVREELGISTDQPVIVMLGGAARPKGTLTMIRAIPAVLARHASARFVIAGPAPKLCSEGGLKGIAKRLLGVDRYKKQVLAEIEKLGIGEALIFTGIRGDIPAVLAASDMLLFPSSVPHFARPAIEAAAMAKPVVASNLGGPAELVIDGETGLLVEPNAPAALAVAINALLDDPARMQQMGRAGRQRAREAFNAEINAAATLALYDELLG